MGAGCSKSCRVAPPDSRAAREELSSGDARSKWESDDPRWDRAGFDAWVVAARIPFVRLGHLRSLVAKQPLLVGGNVPRKELHTGALPDGCGVSGRHLFAVLSPSLLIESSAPGLELQATVQALDEHGASDDDLVFWYHVCVELQSGDASAARDGMFRMFTHYRVQTVLVPSVAGAANTIFERLETMAYLSLATFCQRIVNTSHPEVREGIDLAKLVDLPNTLAGLHCDGHRAFQEISEMVDRVIRTLRPVATDHVGFRVLCEEAQIAWLRVPYIKELAKRGGPCPRRQELDPGKIIVGRLPKGRMVSVSHGWDCANHFSPSGQKLLQIVAELERMGIDDEEDGVFIDFTGLWQRAPAEIPDAYMTNNQLQEDLVDRTPVQHKQFLFALWEMSRMYAYEKMLVIVLPNEPDTAHFPQGPTAWGIINPDPYGYRGWCTSEYSIARFTGRIANKDSPGVEEVDGMREWPTTVAEYMRMMDLGALPRPVNFTKKGDRNVVTFLFYRVCFGLLHAFVPEEWQKANLWRLPDEGKLALAEHSAIGSGDLQRSYYMHVAVQPPSAVAGDKVHTNALLDMQTALLTQQERWVRQHKHPVVFSDAAAPSVTEDLTNGRVHSLIWSAPGSGWERERQGPTPLTNEGLCAVLSELDAEARPAAVFVCMQFGPEQVADNIADTGVPVVVWLRESLLDSGSAILFGIIAPMLDLLAAPRACGMGGPDLTTELHGLGRQVFGQSWQAGGVMLGSSLLPALPRWQPSAEHDPDTPWVHQQLTASAASEGGPASSSSPDELYEALKLVAVDPVSGMPVDLLTCASPAELCEWLEETLPSEAGQKPTVMGLYTDEDAGTQQPALQARVLISSVGFLHELRDVALTGELDQSLSAAPLVTKHGFKVKMDRAQFCRMYEESVLSLDKLTEHQTAKLNECLAADARFVHIKAPAGAGKTFVAMHMLLKLMQDQPDAMVLFVARNVALCYFVVRWMARRVPNVLQRLRVLKRLYVMFEPLQDGPRAVSVRDNRINVSVAGTPEAGFSLVVVDESHHIYSHKELKNTVEQYVLDGTNRLLISDISQSLGWDIEYPEGEQAEVMLTEVVRSTQRIVAGAAAFQLGDKKLLTSNQHNATGPPLKTFIFERSTDAQARLAAYIDHTVKALRHVSTTLGDLDLHDRVAMVVPNDDMATSLRGPLETALMDALSPERPYRLLDAREAATVVAGAESNAADDQDRWLILDSIANFDGLERIIVICVDLDTVIGRSDALTTRSLIYRAMTRAHMLVVVVNEFLEGGWLAFLRTLKLQAEEMKLAEAKENGVDMHADDREAVDRTTAEAKVSAVLRDADQNQMAQKKVAALLTKAVQLSLADAGLPLLDEYIIAETPAALERWHALLAACEPAVDTALQAKGDHLLDDATRRTYVLEAAYTVVRNADGRLPADLDVSLEQVAEAAAKEAVEMAEGWRTPAFYDQCLEAARTIGWETGDNEWLQVGEGGMDLGFGVRNRMRGECGWPRMTLEEAVADIAQAHGEIVRLVDAQGLEPSVAASVLKDVAVAGTTGSTNYATLVQGAMANVEAERDAALGVQIQAVWDVESTAYAPVGELKFTPYPIKKERVEWVNAIGLQVGFELQDNRMYHLKGGKRNAPYGPAHIISFQYPARGRGEPYAIYGDSRGRNACGSITPEALQQVQVMWETAEQHL